MTRPASLFAIGAVFLFSVGIVSPWIHLDGFIIAGFHLHRFDASGNYIIRPQTALFAFAACFGVFAFPYSLWMLQMSTRAGLWHFWLSAVAVMLFCSGFVLIPGERSRTATPAALVFALDLAAALLFLGAQVAFAVSVLSAVLRGAR